MPSWIYPRRNWWCPTVQQVPQISRLPTWWMRSHGPQWHPLSSHPRNMLLSRWLHWTSMRSTSMQVSKMVNSSFDASIWTNICFLYSSYILSHIVCIKFFCRYSDGAVIDCGVHGRCEADVSIYSLTSKTFFSLSFFLNEKSNFDTFLNLNR